MHAASAQELTMNHPTLRTDRSGHGAAAGAAFGATLTFIALMGAFAISDTPRSLPSDTSASSAQDAGAQVATTAPADSAMAGRSGVDADGAFPVLYEVTG
jgi:hypothetical protein